MGPHLPPSTYCPAFVQSARPTRSISRVTDQPELNFTLGHPTPSREHGRPEPSEIRKPRQNEGVENRHRDALRRIYQADDALRREGKEPELFRLVHSGGMGREIDHPCW